MKDFDDRKYGLIGGWQRRFGVDHFFVGAYPKSLCEKSRIDLTKDYSSTTENACECCLQILEKSIKGN